MKLKRIIAAVLIIQLGASMLSCSKEQNVPNDDKVTFTPVPSANTPTGLTNAPDNSNNKEDTKQPTAKPDVTKNPDDEKPADEITPFPTNTIAPDVSDSLYKISIADCEKILAKITGEEYTFSVADKELKAGEETYCVFSVSDNKGKLNPYMAVERNTGTVVYYDDEEIYAFTSFPPDNTEFLEPALKTTEDEIKKYFNTLTKEQLGLPKDISLYTLSVDNWTSVVDGKECYCINVFDNSLGNGILAGVYYAAANETTVYKLDEDGIFIKILE